MDQEEETHVPAWVLLLGIGYLSVLIAVQVTAWTIGIDYFGLGHYKEDQPRVAYSQG